MSVGYVLGAIALVAMLAFLFVPSLLELVEQFQHRRIRDTKKRGLGKS